MVYKLPLPTLEILKSKNNENTKILVFMSQIVNFVQRSTLVKLLIHFPADSVSIELYRKTLSRKSIFRMIIMPLL